MSPNTFFNWAKAQIYPNAMGDGGMTCQCWNVEGDVKQQGELKNAIEIWCGNENNAKTSKTHVPHAFSMLTLLSYPPPNVHPNNL